MYESFIYSVNTVLPIFIIVIIGCIIKKLRFLSDEFFAESERLVFKLALPAMLFTEVATSGSDVELNPKFVIFCVAGIALTFFLALAIVPLCVKDNAKRGAFVQGVYRSNFAILGIPLAENMFGDAGVRQIAMIMPFAIAMFNAFAVIDFAVFAPSDKKQSPGAVAKSILRNIVTNPLIISVILALPFLLFDITLPEIATKSLGYISNLTLPLALLSLGANFTLSSLKERMSLAISATLIKVVLLPVAVVLAALALGFTGVELGVIFILFGGPSAVSGYIMAKNMGGDYMLTGQITLMTTFLCMFTIFAGVFIMKLNGLI